MNTRTEKTLVRFRAGLNCSQAVLTAFADDLKIDENLALSVSCGFGAGMGRLQETCGAVTGSYMVISLYNGSKFQDNKEKKEAAYSMIQKFSERFKAIHQTTDCKTLLKCDLRTAEGERFAKENNLFGTICEDCISDSIKIIAELTGK